MSRKNFLRSAGALLTTLLFPGALPGKNRVKKRLTYHKNDHLVTLLDGYPGNPVVRGRFLNEVPKSPVTFSDVLKWRFSPNPQKEEKINDDYALRVRKGDRFFDSEDDMLVWLGHATWYIRLDGITYLTDPCLESPLFVKRLAALPCGIEDIRNVDYLLVSHSHRDHLDEDSIKKINFKKTTALLPLKMGEIIKGWKKGLSVQEAGWYQVYNTPEKHPRVSFLPAQHWSRRSIGDENEILWGSYLIQGREKTIYFGGDSALAPHFKKIGRLFPSIDIALLSIGAYKPPRIMKGSHTSPEEAVKAFADLGAKTFIPMHYGTFDLADEPLGEPVRKLNRLCAGGKVAGDVLIPDVGEVIYL